jgi:hypothetical protein
MAGCTQAQTAASVGRGAASWLERLLAGCCGDGARLATGRFAAGRGVAEGQVDAGFGEVRQGAVA